MFPSVIQFGFMLLESVEESKSNEFGDSNGVLGIEKLSIQILGTLFEVHDMTRNEVNTCLITTAIIFNAFWTDIQTFYASSLHP